MGKSPLSRLMETLRRWFGRSADPTDPYAWVREPLRKGPGGRSAAVALAEPDDSWPY